MNVTSRGLASLLLALAGTFGLAAPVAALQSAARLPLELTVLPDGELERLRLSDGTVLYGRIVSSGDPVRVGLEGGELLEVPADRIVSRDRVPGQVLRGRYWPGDPADGRLLSVPSGAPPGPAGWSVEIRPGPDPGWRVAVRPSARVQLALEGVAGGPSGVVHRVQLLRGLRVGVAAGGRVALIEDGPPLSGWLAGSWIRSRRSSLTLGTEWRARGGPTVFAGADRRLRPTLRAIADMEWVREGGPRVVAGLRWIGPRVFGEVGVASGGPEGGFRPVPIASVGITTRNLARETMRRSMMGER